MANPLLALIPLITEVVKQRGEKREAAKEKLKAEAPKAAIDSLVNAPKTTGTGLAGIIGLTQINPNDLVSMGVPLWAAYGLIGVGYLASAALIVWGKKKA